MIVDKEVDKILIFTIASYAVSVQGRHLIKNRDKLSIMRINLKSLNNAVAISFEK